jgi:hypothetical protein
MKRRRELDAMHARLAIGQCDRLARGLRRLERSASAAVLSFRGIGPALVALQQSVRDLRRRIQPTNGS